MQLNLFLLLNVLLITQGMNQKFSSEENSNKDYGSDPNDSISDDDYEYEEYPTSSEKKMKKINRLKIPATLKEGAEPDNTPLNILVGDEQKNFTQTKSDTEFELTEIEPRTLNLKSVYENSCVDNELPLTIGRFTIPTARDMLIITKKIIVKYFDIHQKKATLFLHEMRESTIAVQKEPVYCTGIKRKWYNRCLQHVKSVSDTISKNMLLDLERKRIQVNNYTDESNCDGSSMKQPSLNLLKWLAIENVSMDFALPAFLRLIYACTVHCTKEVNPPEKNNFFKDESFSSMVFAVKNHFKKKEFEKLKN